MRNVPFSGGIFLLSVTLTFCHLKVMSDLPHLSSLASAAPATAHLRRGRRRATKNRRAQQALDKLAPLPKDTQLSPTPVTQTQVARAPQPRHRRSGCWITIAGLGSVFLAFLLLAIFLPPISIHRRLADAGLIEPLDDFYLLDADNEVSVDGLTLQVVGDASLYIRITSLDAADYQSANVPDENWHCGSGYTLPEYLNPVGTVYSLEPRGSSPSALTLEISYSGQNPVETDLYIYDLALARWQFAPVQRFPNAQLLQAELNRLPQCVLLATSEPIPPVLGISLNPDETLDPEMTPLLHRVYARGLHPAADGSLIGRLPNGTRTSDAYALMPLISNRLSERVVDSATVENILADPVRYDEHLNQLASFAQDGAYAGLVIDYQSLNANFRAQYSQFLLDLGRALHTQQQLLIVALPFPEQMNTGDWNTGAYDWLRIGKVADEVILYTPLDPQAFVAGGPVTQVLTYAVTRLNRHQVSLALNAFSVEMTPAGQFALATYDRALAPLGQLPTNGFVPPEEILTIPLEEPYRRVAEVDEASHTLRIDYFAEDDLLRSMWLTTPEALVFRFQVIAQYQLGGILLDDALAPGTYPGLLTELSLAEFE